VNTDLAKYLWILIAFLPDIVIRATRKPSRPADQVTGTA
jgi:hypothetical protein